MSCTRFDHHHRCVCGALLECVTADCTVSNAWQCPTCDDRERDEYFQALDPSTTPSPKDTPRHEHQQRLSK